MRVAQLHADFRAATAPDTSPATLAGPAKSEAEIIRAAVASNSATPATIMEGLRRDPSHYVRGVLSDVLCPTKGHCGKCD